MHKKNCFDSWNNVYRRNRSLNAELKEQSRKIAETIHSNRSIDLKEKHDRFMSVKNTEKFYQNSARMRRNSMVDMNVRMHANRIKSKLDSAQKLQEVSKQLEARELALLERV